MTGTMCGQCVGANSVDSIMHVSRGGFRLVGRRGVSVSRSHTTILCRSTCEPGGGGGGRTTLASFYLQKG